MTQPIMNDAQVKELNEELDSLLKKEVEESRITEPPPTEDNSVINEPVKTAEEIENERILVEAAEKQLSEGTMILPPGVSHRSAVAKIRTKFIKINKDDERDIKALLERKNAPKPTIARVPEPPKVPQVTPAIVPHPEYQVFNEVIPAENPVPTVSDELTPIQNQVALERWALNMFHVAQQGTTESPGTWVTITNPWFGPISPDQAINLAVWLVRYAMFSGASITFGELMQAVDDMVAKGKLVDPTQAKPKL